MSEKTKQITPERLYGNASLQYSVSENIRVVLEIHLHSHTRKQQSKRLAEHYEQPCSAPLTWNIFYSLSIVILLFPIFLTVIVSNLIFSLMIVLLMF